MVQAGNPRGDNPVKHSEPVSNLASRGISPRGAFRVSTTENENLLRAQAEAEKIAQAQKVSPSGSSDTSAMAGGSSLLDAVEKNGIDDSGSTVGSSAKETVGVLLASE